MNNTILLTTKVKSMKLKILILSLVFFGLFSYAQETYNVGNTEYFYDLVYVSTGKPMVKRSAANKRAFLESKGYSETPDGYEIDHIIPLSEGGTDDPSNMQLLTINHHKRKTAIERKNRRKSTIGTFNYGYYSNSTYSNNANKFTSNTYSYRKDKKGRLIYRGNKGGEYYYTRSGRKKYIKTKNTTTKNQYYLLNTTQPTIKTKNSIKYSNSFGDEYFILPTRKKSLTKNKQTKPQYTSTRSKSSRTIHTGPRGGKYYINSNGNKTYVKNKSTYTAPKSATSRTIHTGPRGGKYYINSNGNKTYVKRKSTYSAPRSSSSSRTIHTGSRGGRYYINSNGNKTYVKKKN